MFPVDMNNLVVRQPQATSQEIRRIEEESRVVAKDRAHKELLVRFDSDLKGNLSPELIKEKFAAFPQDLRESMKWGFWKLEGEPTGDPDFGQTFFSNDPYHPTVQKTIQLILRNGLCVFPEPFSMVECITKEDRNEFRHILIQNPD